MSDQRLTVQMLDAQRGHTELMRLWAWAKPMLLAGHRLVAKVEKATRSVEQNGLLHSRIGDVAKHVPWAGAKRPPETWKRLLTAAWLRARGESIEILPALDGYGVDVVFRHTSELTVAECVELSDFILAWGDEREVPWCRASLGRDAPDSAFQKPKAKQQEEEATA